MHGVVTIEANGFCVLAIEFGLIGDLKCCFEHFLYCLYCLFVLFVCIVCIVCFCLYCLFVLFVCFVCICLCCLYCLYLFVLFVLFVVFVLFVCLFCLTYTAPFIYIPIPIPISIHLSPSIHPQSYLACHSLCSASILFLELNKMDCALIPDFIHSVWIRVHRDIDIMSCHVISFHNKGNDW